MAVSREVVWKAVANFAQARREADKTRKSFEDLKRSEDSQASNAQSNANKRTAANKSVASSLSEVSRASKNAASSAETEATARQRVTTATLQHKAAVLAAAEAQRKYAALAANAAASDDKKAGALNRLNIATLQVERSSDRLARAQQKLGASLDSSLFDKTSSSAIKMGVSLEKVAASAKKTSNIKFPDLAKVFKFPAFILAANTVIGVLGSLVAGLGALTAAVGPAVGAFAALPQAITLFGTAALAGIAGFAGITEAVKATLDVQKKAGKEAKTFAKDQVNASRKVRDARRSLRDAYESSADATESANTRITQSERNLRSAQEVSADATKRLSQARRDAIRNIRDLKNEIQDLTLSEERASLSLDEAQERLRKTINDPASTDLERRDAELAVREAKARLDEVHQAQKDSSKEYLKAQKEGVKGNQEVIAAQRDVRDSLQAVQDALKEQKDAGKDSIKVQRDNAEAIQRANENLTDALNAQSEAATQTSSSQDKLNDALKDLSPTARNFVKNLVKAKDALTDVRKAAQDGLLWGLNRALLKILTLQPIFEDGMYKMGRSLGIVADRFAALVTKPEFKKDLAQILDSNAHYALVLGDALIDMVDGFRHLIVAAQPFTEWVGRLVQNFARWFDATMKVNRENGKTEDFLNRTQTVLGKLGSILGNLVGAFRGFGKAGREEGEDILDTIVRVTDKWDDWTNSLEGQNRLKEWFKKTRPALDATFRLLGGIILLFAQISEDPATSPFLDQIRTEFLPALKDLSSSIGKNLGPALVDLATKLTEFFATLSESGASQGLVMFAKTLGLIADAATSIIQNVPGASVALGILLGVSGALAALKLVAAATGFSKLAASISRLGGATGKNGGIVPFFKGLKSIFGKGKLALGATGAKGVLARLGLVGLVAAGIYAGEQVAEGFAKGLSDSKDTTKQAAGDFIQVVLKPWKAPKIANKRLKEQLGVSYREAFTPSGANKLADGVAKRFDEIKDTVSDKLGEIKDVVEEKGGEYKDAVGNALSALPGIVGYWLGRTAAATFNFGGTVLAHLKSGFGRAGAVVREIFADLTTKIAIEIVKFASDPKGYFSGAGSSLMDKIKSGAAAGFVAVSDFVKGLPLKIAKAFVSVKAASEWLYTSGTDLVQGLWNGIKDKFQEFIQPIKNFWSGIKSGWDDEMDSHSPSKEFYKRGRWLIQGLLNGIASLAGDVLQSIKDLGTKILSTISSPFEQAITKVGTLLNTLGTTVSTGMAKIKSAVSSAVPGIGGAWDAIKGVFKGPAEFVVNTVLSNVVGAFNKILGFLKMPSVEFGGPYKFARGGKVPGEGNKDTVPALLMPGEFVIRKKAVKQIGASRLEEMNRGSQRFAEGGWVKPVQGPATAGFGQSGSHWKHGHTGQDWGVPSGTQVRAATSGRVAAAGYGVHGDAYGNLIDIASGATNEWYAHLSRILVSPGDMVQRGQIIGLSGATGNVTGPHLHFEVRNSAGQAIDPNPFISGGKGVMGAIGDAISGVAQGISGSFKDIAGNVIDLAQSGAAGALELALKPVRGLLDKMPGKDSIPGKLMTALAEKIMDGTVSFVGGVSGSASGDLSAAPTDLSGNQAVLQKIASTFGWGSGPQWNALYNLVKGESGFNNKAQNPLSSAFGMFQFLDSTWRSYGAKTSDPSLQSKYGLQYIKGRYGSPLEAYSQWLSRKPHWYAMGGAAEGSDTVPAMLTPGEFVMNRDAVKRIGVGTLHQLNKTGSVPRKKGMVQYFHSGGPVQGFKPGASGPWVAAMKAQLGFKNIDEFWGPELTKILVDKHPVKLSALDPDEPKTGARLKSLMTFLKGGTPKKNKSWAQAMSNFGWDPNFLFRLGTAGRQQIEDGVPRDRSELFLKGLDQFTNSYRVWVKALERQLGIANQDGIWDTDLSRAVGHAIYHSQGKTHPEDLPRPWNPPTAGEIALTGAIREKSLNDEYTGYLEQFATVGLDDLVDKLLDLGVADGMDIARDAAKRPDLARKLNAAYGAIKQPNIDEQRMLLKFISFLSTNPNVGLRDVARKLQVPDYGVIDLWNKVQERVRTKVPASRYSRLVGDINSFRAGTFYAATGGVVPGVGNRDSVPAMLTPGEFVIKKEAAKALGMERLFALNNAQKFATGGPVLSLSSPGMPSIRSNDISGVARNGVVSSGPSAAPQINMDVQINNPRPETSSRSLSKAVSRQAALGTFDRTPKV